MASPLDHVRFIDTELMLYLNEWQPTPVPLPGKSHGLRSLVGYSPWGLKESDTTERLYLLTYLNESANSLKFEIIKCSNILTLEALKCFLHV